MKRILCTLGIFIIGLCSLTACQSKKAVTYQVDTGDKITITLKTSGDYDLTAEVPFKITKDGKELSQGKFMSASSYDQLISMLSGRSDIQIVDSGEKDGNSYTFYSPNHVEYIYIIKINNSQTGVLLTNSHSQAEAQECFQLLTFQLADSDN